MSALQAADLVLASAEAVQDRVKGFYQSYLGRAADPGGLALFSSILETGGTDDMVLAGVLSSPEYLSRL